MKKNYLNYKGSKRTFILTHSKVWLQCVRAIGCGHKNLHSLRHTFAVRHLYTYGNIYETSRRLGHSNIHTTERYLQFSYRRLKEDFPTLMGYMERFDTYFHKGTLVTNFPVTQMDADSVARC